MPRGVTLTLEGADEIVKRLQRMSADVARRLSREAMVAAAEPIINDASQRAPRRTGRLASNIVAEIVPGKTHTISIGPSREAWYGLFQELGTRHHAAQPFLRPALDANRQRAQEIAADVLWAGIRRRAR